jgi:hypothetical protein
VYFAALVKEEKNARGERVIVAEAGREGQMERPGTRRAASLYEPKHEPGIGNPMADEYGLGARLLFRYAILKLCPLQPIQNPSR